MSRRLFIKTCVLLAVTAQVRSQYIDFFQNFNSFLQPFTTTKPRNDVTKRPSTKHRQSNKQKYQDFVFFEEDTKQKENSRFIDPFNFYTTTTKPKRKSSKTSTTSHSSITYTTRSPKPNKSVSSNKLINNNVNNNNEVTKVISNNNVETINNNVDGRAINNARRIDNYNIYNNNNNGFYNHNNGNNNVHNSHYTNSETTSNKAPNSIFGSNANRQTTQRTTENYSQRQTTRRTTEYYNNQRQTTHNNYRQTTNFFNNDRTTRRPNKRPHESYTTSNPLLNRPGVIPAVVNDNKPPITNRPITETPVYDRPFDTGTYRPVNTRPPYEIERTTRRPETRPANTRPPFENERPVHRPISSGVRPVTSGVRPGTSGARPGTSGARPVTSGTASDDENVEPDIEIGPDEDEMSESEKRRLYELCEQKCEEYKSARVKKVVALPLSPDSQGVEVNVTSCPSINVPLIIGGQVARIEQFPHMALVGWKKIQNGGYSWKCGGSLISEQFILTAGHCTYHDKDYNVVRYNGPPHAVQLGSALYNDRSAAVLQISLVIRHPKYKLRRSYYDVALIKLRTTVKFSDTISPACLGVPPPVGEPVIATGWGKTEFGGDSSIELRSVSIPIWDMSDCREIWGTSLKLPNGPMPDNQVCAGEPKGAKDTCQGDSGGPAQVAEGCAWRVVAVTSVGRSCGARHTPALYATLPRAFIANQVYTNSKSSRDGSEQYGNAGINNNNGNNRNNGNNNRDNGNNNRETVNNNRGGNNNQFLYNGVANIRPVSNNNHNGNNGRVQNNNAQYGDSQSSSTDNSRVVNNNWSNNNGNNYANNQHSTINNAWNVPTVTTNNNRNNYGNNNNNGQSSEYSNQNYRPTTSTFGYNQNNYGQNNNNGQTGHNNEYNQNNRNTEYPSDISSYGTQHSGYNDNGRTDTYNRDNNNGYGSYAAVNRPWWTK